MEVKTAKIPNILRAKVAVVGQSQVGKTALCHQLSSDGTNFAKNYLMTSIMEVHMRSVNIPDTNDVVELYLLDCSGKELYTDILSTEVWKNVAMVVAMYDVCKEDSFGSVAKWVEQVAQALKKEDEEGTRLTGVLLGNKTDLTERRVVSPKVGSELAQQLGLMYFECSTKDFAGVEDPFYYLANEFHKSHADTSDQLAHPGA